MKKTITIIACAILSLSLLLTSCKKTPVCNQQEDLKPIDHVGTVPEEFEKIISENLFYGVKVFADRLLVSHCVSIDDNAHTAEYVIDMMDLYGSVLASCPYKTGDTHRIGRKIAEGRDYFDNRLGEKNGVTIYVSNQLFKEFDAGSPKAYIDYGDFYLIISDHATGVYEHTPKTISSIWYYRETVYSAYDQDGKLIFRSSVDSSPDYDSLVKEMTGVVFD